MKKILIVDDSAFMRNILRELLLDTTTDPKLKETVEIFEADGKVKAMEQLKSIRPDVILLDIVMKSSETEGLEFLRDIKDTFDTSKIIMITSMGLSSLMNECRKYGIHSYLQKPFEQKLVIDTVNQVLS